MLGCLHAWMLGCLDAWMLGCLDAWMLGIRLHSGDRRPFVCLFVWLNKTRTVKSLEASTRGA
jgi:hypothetical protein